MRRCRRCGCDNPRVKIIDGLCLSETSCTKRLRERVGVRLVLENPPVLAAEEEQDRVAREIRHAYYRFGLCVDCGVLPHSPGRPRCEACHEKRPRS